MLESWDERNAANLLRHLSVRGRVFWHTPCELTTPLACPPLACLSLACLLLVCSRSCLLAHLFELTTPAEIVSFGTTFCNPYPLSEVVSFGTPLPTLYALRGRVFWHTSLDLPIASDLTPRIDPPLPPLTSVTTSTSGGKTLTRGTPLPSNPPCPPLRWRTVGSAWAPSTGRQSPQSSIPTPAWLVQPSLQQIFAGSDGPTKVGNCARVHRREHRRGPQNRASLRARARSNHPECRS
jgi:hypothetical protein